MKQSCGVWICPSCGLPSFNSSLFNSSVETNNSFGSLSEMNNIMGIDMLKSTSTPVKNTKSSKPGKLKVISINVNGLRSKKLQLYELICSEKPDVVLCQETKIDSSILSAELFPESFIVFRKDRNVNGGGVCIAVRRELQAVQCPDLNVEGLEAVWIQLFASNHQPLYICSLYRSND